MAKILVVDDSAFQRRNMRRLLESVGHEVVEAEDGNDGVARACEHRPDLIFSDLLMPNMDGFGLLESMQRRGSPIPVVVVSSNVQQAAQERCTELGARGFVSKPVKPDSLTAVLAEMLPESK